MGLIDFILNLVALLLWLNWRSFELDRRLQPRPVALASTLKRPQPRRWWGWVALGSVPLLLLLRAVLYWQISSAAEWTPKLDLSLVVLTFRADRFLPALLLSVLGFARFWILFYFWLLTLAALNRGTVEPDSLLKLIRLQLGPVVRWPWFVYWLVLPPLAVAALWLAVHPLLTLIGTTLPTPALGIRLAQGLLVSLGLFLSLKYVLPLILLFYLITSYVYLGRSPLWDFIAHTAQNLLKPLRPFHFLRVDFAPVVGVVLLGLLLHWLPRMICSELAKRHLPLWPQ